MSLFGKSNPDKDLDKIYRENKDYFLKRLHEDQKQYPDKAGKKIVYIDGVGNTYTSLDSYTTEPPLERIGKAQEFLQMMAMGLSPEEIDMLIDVAKEEMALAWAGKKNNAPVTVGAVFTAMQERRKLLLHIDLLYEYLAVFTIRQDEVVGHFNQAIHEEKVKQFKADNQGKNSFFFFQRSELKLINDLLKSSESEWMNQCQESQRKIDGLKMWVKDLSTGKKKSVSQPKTETSM